MRLWHFFVIVCLAGILTFATWFLSVQETRPLFVRACEHTLVKLLKSPASYKFVDHFVTGKTEPIQKITIFYDAKNSFNAEIRGQVTCEVENTDKPKLVKWSRAGEVATGPMMVLHDTNFFLYLAKNK